MSEPRGGLGAATLRVAAIQFDPGLFARAANLEDVLLLSEETATGGAKPIATPKMAATAHRWASRCERRPRGRP